MSKRRIPFRTWLSIVTFIAVFVILYFSRHELVTAWHLLGKVNLWIIALLIPLQFLSYFLAGNIVFDYLRGRGNLLDVKRVEMAKISLELNFVNHTLPSGGVSGFSYLGWRLKNLGVSTGRTTMAQVVRFVLTFGSYLAFLLLSILAITLDGTVTRVMILVSAVLVTTILLGSLFLIYIISGKTRMQTFSTTIYRIVNGIWRRLPTKKKLKLTEDKMNAFFDELHNDYSELKQERSLLKKPSIWAIIYIVTEISMFFTTYLALGHPVNPAVIVISYGFAALASFFVLTPGGAGVYELLMLSVLAAGGVPASVAVAGTLLTRVILIVGTILSGYIFYQMALSKYGKQPDNS